MSSVGPCGHGEEDLRVRSNGTKDCAACRRERHRRHKDAHPRLPLVYATRKASEDAAALLGGRNIETVIEEAIGDGRISRQGRNRQYATVHLGGGRVAIVRRATSPITERKAWVAIAVRELRDTAAA